jgi:hydrogenase-4 component D
VAGALSYAAGTKMLPALKGIMRKMPLVGVSFACAALAVTGVPPFNCFFSKFSILAGGFSVAKAEPLLMVLVVIAVIETIGSFLAVLGFGSCRAWRTFGGGGSRDRQPPRCSLCSRRWPS